MYDFNEKNMILIKLKQHCELSKNTVDVVNNSVRFIGACKYLFC